MKSVRWFVGVSLIFFGKLAVWGGQTLFRLGLAVKGHREATVPEVRPDWLYGPSSSTRQRPEWLVPYTVETKDGRHITLYGIRGK